MKIQYYKNKKYTRTKILWEQKCIKTKICKNKKCVRIKNAW